MCIVSILGFSKKKKIPVRLSFFHPFRGIISSKALLSAHHSSVKGKGWFSSPYEWWSCSTLTFLIYIHSLNIQGLPTNSHGQCNSLGMQKLLRILTVLKVFTFSVQRQKNIIRSLTVKKFEEEKVCMKNLKMGKSPGIHPTFKDWEKLHQGSLEQGHQKKIFESLKLHTKVVRKKQLCKTQWF